MATRIYCLICILLASIAVADPYETNLLFKHKSWHVELTHDTRDGDVWCSAVTENRSGQTFNIVTYPDDSASLFVFDQNWNLSPRTIEFVLDIDYNRWTVIGHGEDIGIQVSLDGDDQAGKFILELAEGNAVALYNLDLRRLAVFSLAGSKAALLALLDCWEAISDQTSDPFKTQSDPFG